MIFGLAVLLTLLTVVTVLLMNERIQRTNLETRNKQLRRELRRK